MPPKTGSSVFPVNAPSMGVTSPSDWEYLGPGSEDIDDTEMFSSKKPSPTPSAHAADQPHSHPTAVSNQPFNPTTPASNAPQNVSPTVHISHVDDQIGTQNPPFTGSPVSSGSAQMQHPPPQRVNTADSTQSSGSTTETTEKIDGVIEAWNRPISPDARASASSSRQSSVPRSRDQSIPRKPSPISVPSRKPDNTSPLRDNQTSTNNAGSTEKGDDSSANTDGSARPIVQDPYEDLDPWFKSSLARYVAMLRTESVADSDEERYKLFTAFTVKETKLREILYGIEPDAKDGGEGVQESAPNPEKPAEKVEEHAPSPIESGLIPVESELVADYDGDLEDGEYSPGGRPIIPRLHTPSTIQRPASQPASHVPASRLSGAGADGAAQVLRSSSVPPLATNPPQPIYTPFQYSEGPQRGSDNLSFDRPAYQGYSDLRQASADSGRVMSNAPNSDGEKSPNPQVSSPALNEHSETFIGLIREKSVSYKKKSPRRTSSPPPLPMSLRQGIHTDPIAELRPIVSSPLSKQSETSWHLTTKESLEKYSDDFGYIQEAIRAWEVSAKHRRQELDQERLKRQEESEAHVDALFNDKEIGYADINVLEEEFRQAEARVQLDEERQELEEFINEVFKPLDERLDQEISALRSHYDSALGQLKHENSKIKDSATEKYNMPHTMKIVNDIHRKIELRYQKRVNIALDRERRRKKTERRPLVFMGNSSALKKLDADFDQMEKRNVLEAARDRDERANKLMDPFDDAIMLGLGENQSLLDDVSAKMKKIETSHLDSSSLSDSEVEQILKSVSTLVDSLRLDSESMLHNFGVADSTLNNADYRVSVAEARYSNADHDIFRRLDAEKKKEDAKIQHDLNSKLESIRGGPLEITRKINELLEALGKPLVPEPPSGPDTAATTAASHSATVEALLPAPSRPPTAGIPSKNAGDDANHQHRIRRALEEAKKRNAVKAQGQGV